MADDRRRRMPVPEPTAIVASANVLSEQRLPIPDPEAWQNLGWGYYDSTPEARFAVGWLSSGASRCPIFAARLNSGEPPERLESQDVSGEADEEGQDTSPEPLTADEQAAVDLMDQFAGGSSGQAQMIAQAAVHLTVPGDGYLYGEPRGGGDGTTASASWHVCSADEITKSGDRYLVKTGPNPTDRRELAPDAIVVRFYRQHPRWSWKADSPFRACLGVLREIQLIDQHIEASAMSRLAGAGILVLPSEITFPVSEKNAAAANPFVAELVDTMMAGFANPAAPSRLVPLVVQVKGDQIAGIQHLTFSTPFDERAMELRADAVKRFAAGMDLPAEVVLGLGDANHWSAWQIEESAVKLHVEPLMEALCDALTTGFLHPAMKAAGKDPEGIVVWYDATELTVRADRSSDAREAYHDGVIGWRAYLREIGMSEEDAPDDDELLRKLVLDIIADVPESMPELLALLGIEVQATVPAPAPPGQPQQAPQLPSPGPEAPRAIPERPAAPPPPQAPPPAQAVASLVLVDDTALLEAADHLVYRALERAGGRLSGMARRAGAVDHGCAPEVMHTCVPDALRADNLDALLAGAWDRVPEVAARYGCDPRALTETLDAYSRQLLTSGWPHDRELLADALGA